MIYFNSFHISFSFILFVYSASVEFHLMHMIY